MAGIPADLTVYADSNVSHDHTYYGRGCSNGWGTSGEDGSQTPCADSDAGGRYVATADNEIQKNGTYYHYQAASVSTGDTIVTDNSITPDSFCPLGWQMPYSGTGGDYYDKSRSWKYLFNEYGLVNDLAGSTTARTYPLSYIFSGAYRWTTGRLYFQSSGGHYWSITVASSTSAYRLDMSSSGSFRPAYTSNKAGGYSLRCDFNISNLEKLSMASAFTH